MLTVCEALTTRIQQLLEERKITLYKLALDSGVLYDTLKKITSNVNKSVDFAIVIKIAGGFDMTLEEFVSTSLFSEDNLKI